MGKRLSKIYTRTGDQGETGLGDGSRIAKDHARINAIGSIDELNSWLGVLIAASDAIQQSSLDPIADFLRQSQHRIFDLGGEVSIPGQHIITDAHVNNIETQLDSLNADIPPLDNFILPGGSGLIAHFHLARSVCRRAERDLLRLSRTEDINLPSLKFLNRFSDLLFVMARFVAKATGASEVLWQQN